MERYITNSEQETERLGEKIAARLNRGDVVALQGGLGAGKTALTRGIARALGCAEAVTSPTFAIMNYYGGALPLAHFDVYRVQPDELYNTGFFDYAGGDCVTVVEWSELIERQLCGNVITITIETLSPTQRAITVEG